MKLLPRSQTSVASRLQILATAVTVLGSLTLNLGLTTNALAQNASYPNKSITMIVPFPPGGLADIVARPVAEAMSRELGQPVVIENKAGAGGRSGGRGSVWISEEREWG